MFSLMAKTQTRNVDLIMVSIHLEHNFGKIDTFPSINDRFYKGFVLAFCGFTKHWFSQGFIRLSADAQMLSQNVVYVLVFIYFHVFWQNRPGIDQKTTGFIRVSRMRFALTQIHDITNDF